MKREDFSLILGIWVTKQVQTKHLYRSSSLILRKAIWTKDSIQNLLFKISMLLIKIKPILPKGKLGSHNWNIVYYPTTLQNRDGKSFFPLNTTYFTYWYLWQDKQKWKFLKFQLFQMMVSPNIVCDTDLLHLIMFLILINVILSKQWIFSDNLVLSWCSKFTQSTVKVSVSFGVSYLSMWPWTSLEHQSETGCFSSAD